MVEGAQSLVHQRFQKLLTTKIELLATKIEPKKGLLATKIEPISDQNRVISDKFEFLSLIR